jgi:NADH-quinone oxidoreductase subunit J
MILSLPLASSQSLVEAGLFYSLAAITAFSAVGIAVARNIVRTAVFLLFTLAGISGLYFLLNAEFLAAVQLVIYAGGTLILIVFGVMLTSRSPFSRYEPKKIEVVVALTAGAILVVAISWALLATAASAFGNQPLLNTAGYPLDALGQALLGDFLLPFELSSVILLVVMIGAAFLAKARRRGKNGETR